MRMEEDDIVLEFDVVFKFDVVLKFGITRVFVAFGIAFEVVAAEFDLETDFGCLTVVTV